MFPLERKDKEPQGLLACLRGQSKLLRPTALDIDRWFKKKRKEILPLIVYKYKQFMVC